MLHNLINIIAHKSFFYFSIMLLEFNFTFEFLYFYIKFFFIISDFLTLKEKRYIIPIFSPVWRASNYVIIPVTFRTNQQMIYEQQIHDNYNTRLRVDL